MGVCLKHAFNNQNPLFFCAFINVAAPITQQNGAKMFTFAYKSFSIGLALFSQSHFLHY
jgi:hypothetical protein